MSYLCAWIKTYFLFSQPTVVRKIQPWNTTLIPKGITSSSKSERSDSLTTTIRCTFTAKFWPVINTLQTPGKLTNLYRNTVGRGRINNYHWRILQIFLNNFDRCTQSCLGSKRRRRDVTRDETEHEESTTKVTLTRGPLIIQQEEEPAGKFTFNVKR